MINTSTVAAKRLSCSSVLPLSLCYILVPILPQFAGKLSAHADQPVKAYLPISACERSSESTPKITNDHYSHSAKYGMKM